MECSLPDSSVHGILQARLLEWVAISFSKGSSRPRNRTQVSQISGRFFTNWATKCAAAAAKSHQSCPTLCEPITTAHQAPVPGILQARTLEWAAISFSSTWKWKVKVKSLRRVRLFETPWTVAHQAPPSMGFSRQEYWSGAPLSSPQGVLSRYQNSNVPLLFNMHYQKYREFWSEDKYIGDIFLREYLHY